MTSLFIVNGVEYPRHIGDLWLTTEEWRNGGTMPNGWEPLTLPEGWETVVQNDPPEPDPGYYYREGFPEKQNGVWVRTWVLHEITDVERNSRNRYR